MCVWGWGDDDGTQEEASWNTPSTSYNTTKELQGSSDHSRHAAGEPAAADHAGADGFMSLAAAAGVRSSILPPKQVGGHCRDTAVLVPHGPSTRGKEG